MIARGLGVAALLLLPAAAVAADEGPPPAEGTSVELLLRMGTIWVEDPALDLVSETDVLPRLEFGAALSPASDWSVELSYGIASAGGTTFEVISTHLTLHQFQLAGIRYVPLARRLKARGRLGGAFELAHLRLEEAERRSYSDLTPLLALEGTVGIEWTPPIFPGGLAGFSLDVGYGFRPFAAGFHDLERQGEDTKGIRALPVDVGRIDLSGWVLRFGASLRL